MLLGTEPNLRSAARPVWPAQRQVMAAWLVDGELQRSPLGNGLDRTTAIDTVGVLMDPALFWRLTGDRQWSPDRFRRWLTDSTLRLLIR